MSTITLPKRGLYAVTPANVTGEHLLEMVEQALGGGAVLVQYRAKPQPDADTARALLACCHTYNVPLLINDDVSLAAVVGADGVHLGRDDMAVTQARARLDKHAIIGVSCYNDLGCAATAADAGADYLAFGSVYPSPTKPDAVYCPPTVLSEAGRRFDLPVVAIGGITTDNAADTVAAGADLLAVISDLFSAPDIVEQARRYRALLTPAPARPSTPPRRRRR